MMMMMKVLQSKSSRNVRSQEQRKFLGTKVLRSKKAIILILNIITVVLIHASD